ncbi:MAG: DUF1800 domain-containing protein, partial [Bacteroidota bacterium]
MTHQQKVQHLYWRAGFGQSPAEWKAQENQSLSTIIHQLFTAAQNARELPTSTSLISREMAAMNESSKKEKRKQARRAVLRLNQEWIERMANPSHPVLLEKMTLFWHGHFACITRQPHLAGQQLQTIRQHALGNFKDLVLAMAKDVSMIRFLNNQQNKKRKPNENFARELMELFTIGRGNYTEQDIKAAARAFTGWSSNLRGEYKFKRRQHDYGSKTFMGKTGNFGGEDIIDILLERRETAQFISRKVYRYFVNEKVDERRVSALAAQFYQSNYNITALMKQIFSSDWFYAPENVGVKIKSPIELLVGMMRSLNVQFAQAKGMLFVQKALGQILFRPPNVAGWPGGKSW